jgi:hypothetical protein
MRERERERRDRQEPRFRPEKKLALFLYVGHESGKEWIANTSDKPYQKKAVCGQQKKGLWTHFNV